MAMMVAAPVTLSKLNELEVSLNSIIRGKAEVVRLSVVCLLARGHLLIEDVPGVGKTTLAQALARCAGHCWRKLSCWAGRAPRSVFLAPGQWPPF